MTLVHTHFSMWLIFFLVLIFFLRKKQQENNSEFIQNIFTLFLPKRLVFTQMATETKTKIPSDCHLEGAGCFAPSPTWHWGGQLASRQCGGGWCKAQLLPWQPWECLQGALEWQSVSSRAGKELGSKCTAGWPSPKQPLSLSRPQFKIKGVGGSQTE